MTPQQLVESKVPLLKNEGRHRWGSCEVFCPTCGSHDGFTCSTCRRVVDEERDTPLYEAIKATIPWEERDDQNDS